MQRELASDVDSIILLYFGDAVCFFFLVEIRTGRASRRVHI